MDAKAKSRSTSGMPLPSSSISKLNDHFGQYVICIQCQVCKHFAELEPATLARQHGWQAPFAPIVPTLHCPTCFSPRCTVQIAFEKKPRGWTSNPS